MTLSGYFTSKSVFDQQGYRVLTFALARLSCRSRQARKKVSQNVTLAHNWKSIWPPKPEILFCNYACTTDRSKFWRQIWGFYRAMHYSAKRCLVIACRPSVCPSVRPSVTLVDQDHIGWKSWKLITRTISPTPSLFVAKAIHLLPGELPKVLKYPLLSQERVKLRTSNFVRIFIGSIGTKAH